MSRSNPTATNPATKFFEWSAKAGGVHYFDKALGENGENVDVPLPFKFLYLDDVYQVGGGKKIGKKPHQEFIGYYSNAVKNLKQDTFVVRSKSGVVTEGLYEDVKKEAGVKLIVGLYIAYYDDDKNLQIGYLKLKGSAMGEWWDFTKKVKKEAGVIALFRGEEQTDEDGKTYYLPKFDQNLKVAPETDAKAVELDKTLQAYLATALTNGSQEESASAATVGGHHDAQAPLENFTGEPKAEPDDDDIPF